MPNEASDLERGEGGLKLFEAQVKETSSPSTSPVTPDSPTRPCSQGTTIVGETSLCSDEKDSDTDLRLNIWSRFARSIHSPLSLKKTSLSHIPEHQDDDDDDDDDNSQQNGTNRKSKRKQRSENISIVRKIHEEKPGYPQVATFLDADDNFMIYRRFGYLQTRLILDRQEELASLELDLDMMEKRESRKSETEHRLTSRQYYTEAKQTLLDTIETKFNAYSHLLSNASALVSLNKPTRNEQRSVFTWLDNEQPLLDPEMRFINHKEDLVTLRPGREHAWLDSSIERLLHGIPFPFVRRLFQSPDTRIKSDGKDGCVLYTRSRIENFVVCIITLVILALLIVPIWVLYKFSQDDNSSTSTSTSTSIPNGSTTAATENNNNAAVARASIECIGVLLVSTLAFSACISLFTRAKRHEILAASAAYCAVLVVFFGNLGSHLN